MKSGSKCVITVIEEKAKSGIYRWEGIPEWKVSAARTRRILRGSRVMYVQVTLKKGGMHGKGHIHKDSEQVSTMVKGKVRYVIGGKEYIAGERDIVFIPAGIEHTSEALEDSVYIDSFSPPIELK